MNNILEKKRCLDVYLKTENLVFEAQMPLFNVNVVIMFLIFIKILI